jgi:putative flippase GtrA
MINGLKNFVYKGYKFGIVGILSTVFNYGVFAFLYKIVRFHYILSSIIGYASGLLLGYQLNKNWTFIAQVDKSKSYIVGYITVYAVSLVSSQAFLLFLVEILLINPMYANVLAIVLSTVMNFLGTNFFVFQNAGKTYS